MSVGRTRSANGIADRKLADVVAPVFCRLTDGDDIAAPKDPFVDCSSIDSVSESVIVREWSRDLLGKDVESLAWFVSF